MTKTNNEVHTASLIKEFRSWGVQKIFLGMFIKYVHNCGEAVIYCDKGSRESEETCRLQLIKQFWKFLYRFFEIKVSSLWIINILTYRNFCTINGEVKFWVTYFINSLFTNLKTKLILNSKIDLLNINYHYKKFLPNEQCLYVSFFSSFLLESELALWITYCNN